MRSLHVFLSWFICMRRNLIKWIIFIFRVFLNYNPFIWSNFLSYACSWFAMTRSLRKLLQSQKRTRQLSSLPRMIVRVLTVLIQKRRNSSKFCRFRFTRILLKQEIFMVWQNLMWSAYRRKIRYQNLPSYPGCLQPLPWGGWMLPSPQNWFLMRINM